MFKKLIYYPLVLLLVFFIYTNNKENFQTVESHNVFLSDLQEELLSTLPSSFADIVNNVEACSVSSQLLPDTKSYLFLLYFCCHKWQEKTSVSNYSDLYSPLPFPIHKPDYYVFGLRKIIV